MILTPTNSLSRRKNALMGALGFNLSALGFFKYAPLIGPWIVPGMDAHRIKELIPLPIGISFYTFQGISLVCEAWWARDRGLAGLDVPVRRASGSFDAAELGWFHAKVWFFKAFFPQLIAGPIVKAKEFLHQIDPKALSEIDWDGAVRKLVLGLFLKMVVADNLKEATGTLTSESINSPGFHELPLVTLVLLLYGFSFQIYADFAGYSYLAQGLAKLFGYNLPDNFHHPYLAGSLTEFWRRWHLSLSSWLREYLYIPLGGNRNGEGRTYFNLFLVMFLGGLWHGAAWSYAVWGTVHGIGLAFERWTGLGRITPVSEMWNWRRVVRVGITFHVVSALWLLFQFRELADVLKFAQALLHAPGGFSPQLGFVLLFFSVPVVGQHFWSAWRNHRSGALAARPVGGSNCWLETFAYAAMLALVLVNAGGPGSFFYFQF
jgi:alginate O-acetyltransferase complex protein AlgI